VLRKVVIYYIKKHENVKKIKIGFDLKLLSFLKTKQKIYKELRHFQKFIFIQK
jgi:hypothetical protein